MMSFNDIRIYLPKYLSEESTGSLFNELSQFPNNIDSRIYSLAAARENAKFLQGDGIKGIPTINLPDNQIRPSNVVIISNSCDIDSDNHRLFTSSVCYCPIYNLEKYRETLRRKLDSSAYPRIDQLIADIRSQRITQIFFLPRGASLEYEGFIFFDRICSFDNASLPHNPINDIRLFSLSNYGFYLFLFKLSIHFTRIRECIDRP